MATFDTTRLVNQVALKGALPDGRFTDQEILDLASDVLISEIAPILIASREEYYVTTKDQTVTASQAAYPIPYRAMGATLREVKIVRGTRIVDLIRLDPESVESTEPGEPNAFYLQGNNVILHPTPDATGDTLRMTYFVRPSSLVPTTECARITNIAGNVLTASIPTGWDTSDTFDLVQGSSGYVLKGADFAASQVNSGDITLTGTLPSDLAVGDYISLSGESCFPHIPADAHQLLVQLTVVSCLEAMGDQTNLPIAAQRAQSLKQAFGMLLMSRIQGAPRKFTSSLI
jgi:hypothetical protein